MYNFDNAGVMHPILLISDTMNMVDTDPKILNLDLLHLLNLFQTGYDVIQPGYVLSDF